jgi:hypothetical protein
VHTESCAAYLRHEVKQPEDSSTINGDNRKSVPSFQVHQVIRPALHYSTTSKFLTYYPHSYHTH